MNASSPDPSLSSPTPSQCDILPIPSSFICPLSRKLMEEPVMDRCAHTFERSAIVEWISTCKCCPISRKPLSLEELVPNHILSERMDKWKWQREFHDDLEMQQQQQRVGDDVVSVDTTSEEDDEEEEEDDDHDVDKIDSNEDCDHVDHHTRRRGGLARKHFKTGRFSRQGRQRRQYATTNKSVSTSESFLVPVEFMLLPQERETLQAMYIRAEQARLSQQRSRCLRTVLLSGIAVAILVLLSVGAAKFYYSNNLL